ncbi:MAG: hypothetical protein IJK60_00475 [Clostridia bacterium]|nr:hypothetical protein [Clostridia bacterium]
MKKTLCLILSFALCMTLAACGADKADNTAVETSSPDGSAVVEIAETEKEITEKNSEPAKKSEEKSKDETKAPGNGEWIKAYKDVLLNLDKADIELTTQEAKFCLCFIDGDSVPELVVSTGDFHAACCYVFTFSGGKAVNLGPFGSFGTIQYIEKIGIIIDSLGNNGYFNETYYKLENGIIDALLDFEIETRETENYLLDGKEITKAQYNSLVSEVTNGTKPASSPNYEKCFAVTAQSVDKNLK